MTDLTDSDPRYAPCEFCGRPKSLTQQHSPTCHNIHICRNLLHARFNRAQERLQQVRRVAGKAMGAERHELPGIFRNLIVLLCAPDPETPLHTTTDADPAAQSFREDVLLSMGVDWTWYTRDVLLDEVDEDPPNPVTEPTQLTRKLFLETTARALRSLNMNNHSNLLAQQLEKESDAYP